MPVLLSWNVAGRVRSVPEQAAALASRPADVVALQEVRASALAAWTAALHELDHVLVRDLEVRACGYEHGWREARLSDHSAIWADVGAGCPDRRSA